MKIQRKIIGLFILLLFFGCQKNEIGQAEIAEDKVMFVQEQDKEQEINIERKLIKEGDVEFETNDINTTRKSIFESIKKYKGYISTDQEYKSIGRISNTISVRVPAENFDLLLSESTKGISKFDRKNIELRDVTEEFIDVRARLKTKKELEQRYLDLLKQAKSTIEILEIEKQIGKLRAEIESIEGRLKYLNNKVLLSTLTITFYQIVPNETEFSNKFKNGFRNGWDNLIWSFVFIINIWPFILIVIGLILGIKIWRKRKYKAIKNDNRVTVE